MKVRTPQLTSLGRRGIGAMIAGVGGLLCFVSGFLSWYGAAAPYEMPIRELVQASATGSATSYWGSVAAPLAILGAMGMLGALLRSRLLLGLAWLIGVATLVLWGLMRAIANATDQPPASADVRFGLWACVAGLLIVLLGIAVMGPRREEVDASLSMFDDDPAG